MLSEKFFDTGEVILEYGEGPDNGPPLVFVVGAPNRFQSYCLKLINILSQRWRIYAINHRGTGKSGRIPGKYRMIDFTNDIVKFIEQLDEPTVLFGHSFGGSLCITAASRLGEKVMGVVAGDPLVSNEGMVNWVGSDWFQSFFDLLISFKNKDTPGLDVARTLGDGEITPYTLEKVKTLGYHDKEFYESLRDTDELLDGVDLCADLAVLRCPVMLIQADKVGMGQAVSDADVDYAKRVLPSVVHFFAEGLSHELGIEIAYKSPVIMTPIMQFLEYLRP